MNKKIHVFGGGTLSHIKSHLAICAPAGGSAANYIYDLLLFGDAKNPPMGDQFDVELHLTKLAQGSSNLETNQDVEKKVAEICGDPRTKIVFFSCALVDFEPALIQEYPIDGGLRDHCKYHKGNFGKYEGRFETSKIRALDVNLVPARKIITQIRKNRKDIFLVGFKTTCGATKQEMFEKGLGLCKEASCNLVLVNEVDKKARWNLIVTPEESAYHETTDRNEVLRNLVDMALLRSHLTFTQSTVVAGDLIPWNSDMVPDSLRQVVNYCVTNKAYKPFRGGTVGHFAVKLADDKFLTSIRKSNFNDLDKTGLVLVKTDGPDTVLAYGAKPSVGGQSQRIVFSDHVGFDCIVHFHSPLRENPVDDIPVRSQREVECGSHECGRNTSGGLKQFGNLKAVYLDKHGPNIVFPRTIAPQEVIDFIERNFELSKKKGGYHL